MVLADVMKRYGFAGFLRLMRDVIYTRCVCRKARIIRYPSYIRNDSSFCWGENFTSGVGLRIDILGKKSVLQLGKNIQVNDYVHIAVSEKLIIGDNVLIASKVFISDHNHGLFMGESPESSPLCPPISRPLESKPVIISDNVWIGEGVAILPGVTIGKGCIIGSNAVVNRDIPDYCLAVGVPARVIKTWCFQTNRWVTPVLSS